MQLNCLIVDDEHLAIDVLAGYIPQVPFLHLSGAYSNPIEALTHLQKEKIDLIFLDIQMPKLSGLQFMNLLKSRSQVVIVSAFNEFALAGYDHDVTDYLLKPVSFERFLIAAEKARHYAELLEKKDGAVKPGDFIFVRTDSRMVKINYADILYVEGLRNYISFHLVNNKKIITLQNMKTLEEILPADRFVRVQKSYIINIDKVDAVERQRIFIGTSVIPIGESYSENFFSLIERK